MKTFQDYLNESGEFGTVQAIVNPLFYVSGLPTVRPQEVVITENGSRGIVQVLLPDLVEVLMLDAANVSHSERVARINETATVEVSEGLFGRVVNPLCVPIDPLGPIAGDKVKLPIDLPPPGILTRARVTQPVETGVTIVDMMIQIGKGQKELVIGDQKTGKTNFLLQTMISQAKKGAINVYVCIGKKKSDLYHVEEQLRRAGALERTIIVAATSSDPVSHVYLAPFTGFTIAEFFRDRGQDVFIALDDMTTHAKFYREIALVAKKTPGRGSYPGDIFHHQARLLERTGNIRAKDGKVVSITSLPVAETQEGDLTGYIQTNLMAMTDGHIFFDVEEFKRGRRPAINHTLSVTRVGNQTQSSLEKEIRQILNFRLNKYYLYLETSSFGVELPLEYSKETDFGQKIVILFNQKGLLVIGKPMQYILFGLLFSDFWLEKSLSKVEEDVAKLMDFHQQDQLAKIELEVVKAGSLANLVSIIKSNLAQITKLTDGDLYKKATG